MENSVTQRIFEVIETKRISSATVSQVLGITRANLTDWKMGRSEPSPKIIIKFLYHFPEVDANWLIRGTVSEKPIQMITGSHNMQAGLNIAKETSNEAEYLRAIISEKNEQILLIKEFLKNKG